MAASVRGAVGYYTSPTVTKVLDKVSFLYVCVGRNSQRTNPEEVVGGLHRDQSCFLIQPQGTGLLYVYEPRKKGARGEKMTSTKPQHQAGDVDSERLTSSPEALGLISSVHTPQGWRFRFVIPALGR